MKGVIIAGGFGTRLRPLTNVRPKHLLPVANRPFLEYQVALLKRHGIEEIVFATNYFANLIQMHFGDGSAFGVSMHFAIEEEPLGTAGAIRNAAAQTPGGPVLVLNGDILTDFDIGSVLQFHRSRGAVATIALRPVARPHGFGVVETEPDGRVTGWREPTEEEKRRVAEGAASSSGGTDFINAGVYVLEPEALERIPVGRAVSIERETFPELLDEKLPVYGTAPEGFWMDIGRPEQYLQANEAVLTQAVQTDVPFHQVAQDAEIDAGAVVDTVTALGPGVRIGKGSVLSRCVLLEGVTVGENVHLDGLIADLHVDIEDDARARPGVVLGPGTVIGRGSRL